MAEVEISQICSNVGNSCLRVGGEVTSPITLEFAGGDGDLTWEEPRNFRSGRGPKVHIPRCQAG